MKFSLTLAMKLALSLDGRNKEYKGRVKGGCDGLAYNCFDACIKRYVKLFVIIRGFCKTLKINFILLICLE